MSEAPPPLAGKLLIAMPGLVDPNFWHAVVLVGVHSSEEGAFGLVINRPLNVELNEILAELGESVDEGQLPQVLAGGPVEPNHGFVVFEGRGQEPDEAVLAVASDIMVSGSTETLAKLARGRLAGRYHLFLGYSGWHPGQLEQEIEDNSWLVAPLDTSIIFEVPIEERWTAALRSIGVEPGTLVDLGSGAPT
ncbi:MAG TPA: YqgE/AlgH family protein [Thermoanaerobaculales bacterium]|nr:YqgE/AlgH family protein [Thermoanaerobaculales bacterium]